jgi:hypothetical protein
VAAGLIKDNFVAVAVNSHNGGASDGAHGRFLQSLGNKEGNYFHVATAGGQVLFGSHLSGINSDVHGALRGALKKWEALPEGARKPGAVKVPPALYPPRKGLIQPPPGGLVLRVYMRNLKRDKRGEVARITAEDVKDRKQFPADNWRWADAIFTQPMPDVMWIREAEWKALVPKSPRKGDRFAVPEAIKQRLFRYHLINGTFGLPEIWWPGQFRSGRLTLTVEEVSPILRLRLRGAALMATDADPAKAQRGYDARLTGTLEYDPGKGAFTRFDVVALGDWWGGEPRPAHEPQFARPGRTPFGVAFELARGDRAADLMPPKGQPARAVAEWYFFAERQP